MNSPASCPYFEISDTDLLRTVSLKLDWTFPNVPELEVALEHLETPNSSDVLFRCGGLQTIDIAGAWVLHRKSKALRGAGVQTEFAGFKAAHFKFLENIENTDSSAFLQPSQPDRWDLTKHVRMLGYATTQWISDVGSIGAYIFDGVRRPNALALRETVRQIGSVGLHAVPIVALISCLMGLVMAYQGALQLKQFGATVFVVDLVTISVLREMGVIMASIMVAGRSGSAFAASLGVMNINQETDALRVMGLDPNQVLIAPRVVALVIALPLLTIVADITGLLGGWLLCVTSLDMTSELFLERLRNAADASTVIVGLIKAPFFALLIGAVATLRGMQVQTSAEELGRMTTVAVVQSIFLVVLADGLFSVVFARWGL